MLPRFGPARGWELGNRGRSSGGAAGDAGAGRESDARAALRAGLQADPDPDVRTRLLVELGTLTDDADERNGLYREAVTLNGNLLAAASAAVALRAK